MLFSRAEGMEGPRKHAETLPRLAAKSVSAQQIRVGEQGGQPFQVDSAAPVRTYLSGGFPDLDQAAVSRGRDSVATRGQSDRQRRPVRGYLQHLS